MSFKELIPPEFIPFIFFITEVTPVFISFSIPNTTENYQQLIKLIEPKLHPSIVEIQQSPDPAVNIFLRIFANSAMDSIDALQAELLRMAFGTLDPVKEAQDIIDNQ